jgi:hypothetical protein
MSRKLSGWQRTQARDYSAGPYALRMHPHEPSKWETLLKELCLNDTTALLEVAADTQAGRKVRGWIKRYAYTLFVPEEILRAMGVRTWM